MANKNKEKKLTLNLPGGMSPPQAINIAESTVDEVKKKNV